MAPNKSNGTLENGKNTSSSNGVKSKTTTSTSQAHSDQYSDGKAAKVWQLYIGESNERTTKYKSFLVNLLKEKNCLNVLDAACGTGVDSVMLLEEGFNVVSADFSDKMLKTCFETRWNRRKEEIFDKWDIYEANWLSLVDDVPTPKDGFDALICMGNSFAHLPDVHGDQRDHVLAFENFYKMLKPGGLLVIDHRNYDYILYHGRAPTNNIYYNSKYIKDIKTSVLYVDNNPIKIILDYEMDVSVITSNPEMGNFRLEYYPHRLDLFTELIKKTFGKSSKHTVFADYKNLDTNPNPAFYIHTIEKPL